MLGVWRRKGLVCWVYGGVKVLYVGYIEEKRSCMLGIWRVKDLYGRCVEELYIYKIQIYIGYMRDMKIYTQECSYTLWTKAEGYMNIRGCTVHDRLVGQSTDVGQS